jgi:uncharacterized membrane protein YphA (DoxX/SURF4 family)
MVFAVLAAQLALAAVFVRSGLAKLASPDEFVRAVANYRLLPPLLNGPVARGLPVAEVAAGGLLLLGVGAGPVALLLAILLVAFSVAVAINLSRGRRIECGCRGAAPSRITWAHVAGNLVLAAAALMVTAQPLRSPALWPWSGPLPDAVGRVTVADGFATVLALAAAYVSYQLARYLRRMARVVR